MIELIPDLPLYSQHINTTSTYLMYINMTFNIHFANLIPFTKQVSLSDAQNGHQTNRRECITFQCFELTGTTSHDTIYGIMNNAATYV